MPDRPTRNLAIFTQRDNHRRDEYYAAAAHWAEVDRDIADALGESSTIPVIDQEAADVPSQP